MPRPVTYSSVTKFDSDGDGMPDTSASGTLTREFDDHGNLFHDLSTTDLNGDGTPDFIDDSHFTYDANNNVATEVTESHGPEDSSLAKLMALATDRGTDGVINHQTTEQFTYDDQGRQITHTIDTDVGADGSVNERSVYTTVYSGPDKGQSTLTVDTGVDGTVDKRFTAQNTYDQNNHLLTSDVVADNDGDGKIDYREVINNVYDAQGHLVSEHQVIDRDANGANDFLYTAAHTYNAQGELVSSDFKFDFNGDDTNDIETVVALTDQTTQTTDQTTQTTDQTTQTTDQTTQTNKVVAVPDYFGLLDRNQDDKPGVTFSDFDNGTVGQDLGHPEGKGDGVIDSYDSKLPFDRTDLQALNDILSGGDPQKYANRYAIDDSGRDRRADLVNLKGLLEKYGDPDKPYPTHKEALTDQTTQTTDQTTQTTDQTTQTTDQTTQTTDQTTQTTGQTTQTTDQHQTTQPTADSGKSSLPLAPFDGDHHNDIYTHDLALPGIHDTGDWFFT